MATGATFLNLSLLTSDFFAVAIGVLLFGDNVPDIYALAFLCTVGGLVVFHLKTELPDIVVAEHEAGGQEVACEDAERLLLGDRLVETNADSDANDRM
jgi:hypothetical protein